MRVCMGKLAAYFYTKSCVPSSNGEFFFQKNNDFSRIIRFRKTFTVLHLPLRCDTKTLQNLRKSQK